MPPTSPTTSDPASAPDDDCVVRLEGVGKRFGRARVPPFLIRDLWTKSGKSVAADDSFWALDGVDLEVRAGESVAVLGENGSGKSTLLSLLAGATWPTKGRVSIRGRVAPLLALGVGFQMDMSAPENAYVNASLLGLSRDDAASRLGDILAFAQLGEFVDVPLRSYSSGMIARLGFAVAMHIDADVLLVDEVLAVGDGAFQEKCLDRIRALREAGTTIILVTHDLSAARRVATRAVWLAGGKVQLDDDVETCVARYEDHLGRRP